MPCPFIIIVPQSNQEWAHLNGEQNPWEKERPPCTSDGDFLSLLPGVLARISALSLDGTPSTVLSIG